MVRDLITFSLLRRLTLLLVPVIGLNIAQADVLDLPAPPKATLGLPQTGMTMNQVEAKYGEPSKRYDTVSNPGTDHRPPINRWDYPSFSVIFEREKVIHTVSPQNPPTVSPQANPPQ